MTKTLPYRINLGALSFVLMLLAFPLVFVAKWLLLPGILGGSLDACIPQLPWLKYLVLIVAVAVSLGFVVLAIAGMALDSGRTFGIATLVVWVMTLPAQLIILVLFTYGDAGYGGPQCVF
jgi:hypothetical protein